MIFAMGFTHKRGVQVSMESTPQAISGHPLKLLNGSWRETSTWCTCLAQVEIKLTPFPSVWGSLMTVYPSDSRAFSLSYRVWVSSCVAQNLDGSFSTSPKSAVCRNDFDFWFGPRTPMILMWKFGAPCLDIPMWHNRLLTHTILLSCFLQRCSSNLGVWQSASRFELQCTWQAATNDWGPAKDLPLNGWFAKGTSRFRAFDTVGVCTHPHHQTRKQSLENQSVPKRKGHLDTWTKMTIKSLMTPEQTTALAHVFLGNPFGIWWYIT